MANQITTTIASNETPQREIEEDPFPLQKKIKTEPKDDYDLAEEECARKASDSSIQTEASIIPERWKYEQNNSASPVFERIPSFAADECHHFMNDNCKQCFINETRQTDIEGNSLHRRRQIREFEQGGEEPLSNKIRVWKEKRLEKSQVVRGLVRNAEGFYQRTGVTDEQEGICEQPLYEHQLLRDDSRGQHVMQPSNAGEQIEIPGEHHVTSQEPRVITSDHHVIASREQHMIINERPAAPRSSLESQSSEEETGKNGEQNFGIIRYLLTRNNSSGPSIVSTEGNVEMQGDTSPVPPENNPITMAATSMPVVLTSPGVVPPSEYGNSMGTYPRVSLSHSQSTAAKTPSKVTKKRSRQQATGSNFLERLGKGRHESPTMASKSKENKSSADGMIYQEDLDRGQFGQGSTILPHIDVAHGDQNTITGEQYISDIQRPYCNIPDDHQVTHINGVMSLPATRETRYGITLGELKRRTGFPEYLTRVDLIAYVRQSKSAGRALLDKYNISTAGQKSRPTILSKMCENEARVLGDGICRMNNEYFPWKALAKVASNKTVEGKDSDGKVEQKLKAIQNTRTMLKEMYDLMVENKDISCMKTFEVASHTFGTANILNHLTIFDRLFAEYQNNLIRNSGENL
ncbi:uncharacterized protein LOC114518953 isoform X2 [Dendronephthya gigantea]|uniref:uncharacterized protein LOC114518953 isoform X2 n=1 Tax=Dendronephthya gigantea TaxID=151771 RepID=UPI00106A3633|nr:uncharacterized protein LOC114518953 isoform X2 [Dendronephthya gigantea]